MDQQSIKDWLDLIVPTPGPGHWAAIHTLFTLPSGKKAMPGKAFESTAEAANYAAYWLNREPQEMFYCISTQGKLKPLDPAKKEPKYRSIDRGINNTVSVKVIFQDLDVKPGAYASQAEAMQALIALVKEGVVPAPTAWVSSGAGIHVYWILDAPVTHQQWESRAMGFGNYLLQRGMHLDRFFGDSCRVLRAPGMLHCKDIANPKPVRIIGKVATHRFTLADFDQFVGTPAPTVEKVSKPGQGSPSLHVVQPGSSRPQNAQDRLGAGAVAALVGNVVPFAAPPLGGTSTKGELASGINEAQAQPIDMASVVERCEVLKDVVARGGSGDPEPFWRHALYAASFAKDGREWAHKFSSGDPRYSIADTDAKFDTILNQRQNQQGKLGWPSCVQFNQHSAKCQSCPFQGRVYSPMNIPGVQDDSDVPKGYYREAGTFWKKVLRGEGKNQEEVPVHVFGYGMRDAYLEETVEEGVVLSAEFVVPHAKPRRLKVPVTALNQWRDRVLQLLGRAGISVNKKLNAETQEFFVAFLKLLQDRAGAIQHRDSYGWTTSRDGKKGFAFAGSIYRADGSKEVIAATDGALDTIYRPKGDIGPWRKAADMILSSGRTDLALVIASAFAGPLVRFTGQSGLLISAYSPKSGVQKSTAMQIAQAVWGDPKRAMNRIDDTSNSVLNKIGTLRHLPILWDELNQQDTGPQFVKTVFSLAQGTEKSRLNSDISQRHTGSWATMLVAASNFSVQDIMTTHARNSAAGLNRVLEMVIKPMEAWGAKPISLATSAALMSALQDHYGVAGQMYAVALARREATLEALVHKITTTLEATCGTTAEERFWVFSAATLLAGASIARAEGLADFDIPAMRKYLEALIRAQRVNKQEASVDVSAPEFVSDVVARYVSHLKTHNAVLITDTMPARGNPLGVSIMMDNDAWKALRAPRLQIAKHDGKMRIERFAFLEWLSESKIPHRQILDGLKNQAAMQTHRAVLGAGTAFATGRLAVLDLDYTTGTAQHNTFGNIIGMYTAPVQETKP